MDQETIKKMIIKECEDFLDHASDIFPKFEICPEDVSYSFRLHSGVAGRAAIRKTELRFNLILAETDWNKFKSEIIPHEIAHLYQYKMFPGCTPHGEHFKYVMLKLGLNPNRCHDISLEKVKNQKDRYAYFCGCTTFYLSQTLHNKILKGQKRHCVKCNKNIFFIGKIEKEDNTDPAE